MDAVPQSSSFPIELIEDLLDMVISFINAVPQSSSFPIELVEELLDMVISSNKEEDSLGMTEDSDGIGFPCSEDFEFYMNIAQTIPEHSPGNQTFSSFSDNDDIEGPTPPTSPGSVSFDPADWIGKENESESSLRDYCDKDEQESQQSHRSQGIYLEATQVPVLTQKPDLLSQVLVEKREEINIQDDLKLSSEQEDVVFVEIRIESSSDDEDETSALPLTFNCRADLDRKLNTMDPCPVASSSSTSELAQKHKINLEPNDLATKKIKLELIDNTEVKANESKNKLNVNNNALTDQTSEEALNGEGDTLEGYRTDPSSSIRITTSWSHLLQKPPRLGLSRLERKVNILHEVTILETEE